MKKARSVEEYIKNLPIEVQNKLNQIRTSIRSVAPEANEGLKWGMPAFYGRRILVTFAGYKHHISFYPTPSAVKAFKKDLSKYKTAKGSIQFPLDKPLPLRLISRITKFRIKENLEKDSKWKQKD
ncbi:MAG: hypothetical protein A2539_08690 [Elusimicrobia bacterium RIFOXYD2_FULL_34_15]|nr:MAG: hypothetical protein A2539_08690 [Elusimicrobia bacterium RIFOXYD2_FULL_34_15]